MMDHTVTKYSPVEGFMHNIGVGEVTMTRKAANKRKYLLTKSNRSNTMSFEELFKSVEAVEAPNEAELQASLEANGVSEAGINVAKAVARLFHAYSDEVDSALITKSFTPQDETEDGESISKSDLEVVPAAVRAKIEKALDENGELRKRVDELATAFGEASDEAKTAHFVGKAAEIKNLPSSADEVGALLKTVADTAGDELAGKILDLLRSADAQAESGTEEVLKSHGTDADGDGMTVAKIDAMAADKATAEKITKSEALLALFKSNSELESIYRA
jgi:cell division septum initiation protein DivIVA